MAFKSSTLNFVVLALVMMCALHAMQTRAAAPGEMTVFNTGHRRDLKQAIECSPGQAATSANECNIDITDGTRYFVCLSGVAAGGCRTQSQGTFGSACTRSCVIY